MKANRKDLRRLSTLSTMAANLIYAYSGLSKETMDLLRVKETKRHLVEFGKNISEVLQTIKEKENA